MKEGAVGETQEEEQAHERKRALAWYLILDLAFSDVLLLMTIYGADSLIMSVIDDDGIFM